MSKFWQKKYISKYTGAEIDAAVAQAGTVPAVTAADAGKALVVDSEGKIVPGAVGNIPIIEFTNDELTVFLGAITPKLINLTDTITTDGVTLSASTTHVPEIYAKLQNAFATLGAQGYMLLGPGSVNYAYCRELTEANHYITTNWTPFIVNAYNIKCMLSLNIKLMSGGDIQFDIIAQKINQAAT